MAEENTTISPVEARLDRIENRLGGLENRVSRIEGLLEGMQRMFEQMDRRVTNLEQNQRWLIGLVLATWVSLMLAVVGLYFKGG
jgi:archaellum component FlaC